MMHRLCLRSIDQKNEEIKYSNDYESIYVLF